MRCMQLPLEALGFHECGTDETWGHKVACADPKMHDDPFNVISYHRMGTLGRAYHSICRAYVEMRLSPNTTFQIRGLGRQGLSRI